MSEPKGEIALALRHRLEDTRRDELLQHYFAVEEAGLAHRVRPQTADPMRHAHC